jgi:hypothetical protein
MNRTTPIHTGRVRIGELFWPRRSAQYASWMDTYPTRRRRTWKVAPVVIGLTGLVYLAAEVLRWWIASH